MAIWQSQDGSLHDDMDGKALTLTTWPQGMTLLTDVEVATVRAQQAMAVPIGQSPPDPVAVLTTALAAKGIIITDTDLQAARTSLAATPATVTAIQASL